MLAAVVIGVLGFFYELKASNQGGGRRAPEEGRGAEEQHGGARAKNSDIDQVIRQQQEAAAAEAAARAASDAAAAQRPSVKPMLTGSDFQSEVGKDGADTRELARKSNARHDLHVVGFQTSRRFAELDASRHRCSRRAFRRWTNFAPRAPLRTRHALRTRWRSHSRVRGRLPKIAIARS